MLCFSTPLSDAVIYIGGMFMEKRKDINSRISPGTGEVMDIKLSEVVFDKSELIARGKIHKEESYGRFAYSLYDGAVNVIWEKGNPDGDKESLRDHIRSNVLDKVFPLAGSDFINDLLEKEKKTIPMVNGFLQVNLEIQPADVLLMLCDVTGHEQVFSKNGQKVLVRPAKNGYSIFKENSAAIYAKTYSDVIKILGDDCIKVFNKPGTEKTRDQAIRPIRINEFWGSPAKERTI